MPDILTFLETIPQVQWFAQQAPQEIRRGTVFAISPNAAYTCQQHGIPYCKIEDYAHLDRRLQEVKPVLNRFLELETWLNNWAQQAIPEFGERGFRPASGASFLLQLLFIEIWSTTICLQEILTGTQPDRVIHWSPTIAEIPRYLHPNVSPIPALLPSVCQAAGVSCEDLSHQHPGLAPVSTFYTLPMLSDATTSPGQYAITRVLQWGKSVLRKMPYLANLRLIKDSNDLVTFIRSLRGQEGHVLCSGYAYDLTDTIRALRKQGIRVTVLDDALPLNQLRQAPTGSSGFDKQIALAGSQLLQKPAIWAPLEEWGLRQEALWAQPLSFWWSRLVPVLWSRYQSVQALLTKKSIDAVLTWDTTGSTLSSAADNAASVANIPCYLYQHGSSCEVDAQTWQCFLRPYQTFLAYGKGTVDGLEQSCPPFLHPHARIIPVGSARLDNLSARQDRATNPQLRATLRQQDNRPIILYIPTIFGGYGRMFDLLDYPDVSYLELLQKTLLLWKEYPQVRLLYKDFVVENNTDRVMAKFIQEHIPNGAVTYQRLTELMWAVDAIIVDHVITAVSEVFLTRKPILVYMPSPERSDAEAKSLLQKRAIVSTTAEEFEQQVHLFLQATTYEEIEQPDVEFLKRYCTHHHDGQSAERAASFLRQEIQRYDSQTR